MDVKTTVRATTCACPDVAFICLFSQPVRQWKQVVLSLTPTGPEFESIRSGRWGKMSSRLLQPVRWWNTPAVGSLRLQPLKQLISLWCSQWIMSLWFFKKLNKIFYKCNAYTKKETSTSNTKSKEKNTDFFIKKTTCHLCCLHAHKWKERVRLFQKFRKKKN